MWIILLTLLNLYLHYNNLRKADITYVDSQLATKATTTQVSSLIAGSSGGGITEVTLNSRFPAPFAPNANFALACADTCVIPWIKSDGVMEIGK